MSLLSNMKYRKLDTCEGTLTVTKSYIKYIYIWPLNYYIR